MWMFLAYLESLLKKLMRQKKMKNEKENKVNSHQCVNLRKVHRKE